jgi:hypothetical protein
MSFGLQSLWRKRVGVEPTQDRLRPLPGLKSGRPTGSDSLPCLANHALSYRSPVRGCNYARCVTETEQFLKRAILHREPQRAKSRALPENS